MPHRHMLHRLPRRRIVRSAFLLAAAGTCPLLLAAYQAAQVGGRVRIIDRGDRPADDVAQAVVWLERATPAPVRPMAVEIGTEEKQFRPHVLVVPVGSTVSFSNHDPFNHNVFSQSEENQFDLGLYGRGESRGTSFLHPGVVRVYCNVHAQMSAVVIVRDSPWFTQPSTDGSFVLSGVPPGGYVLHAWHERAQEATRDVRVRPGPGGVQDLQLELDARGYKFKRHLNKFGRPYPQQGRRY